MKYLLLTILLAWASLPCLAEDHDPAPNSSPTAPTAKIAAAEEISAPTIVAPPRWAGSVVTAIFAMFLAAIPIGIFVRANLPREEEPAPVHHDPHGSHGYH